MRIGSIGFAIAALAIGAGGSIAEDENGPRVEVLVGRLLPEEGGAKGADPGPLQQPFGVDFDAEGTMSIVELGGGRVHALEPDGTFRTIAGDGSTGDSGDGGPAREATFNGMHNIAVTPGGTLYIADSWNHRVRRIDPKSGTIDTIAGTGEAGYSGDGGPASQASFAFIMCVTLDHANKNLYLADLNNRRVRVVNLDTGIVSLVAGNGRKGVPDDGAKAINAPLVDPRAVAPDSKGRVYILERGGHALRVVEPDGTIHTVAGTGEPGDRDGPARQAQFRSPKHISIDRNDNIYIADDANGLIRKYDPRTRRVTTVLGQGRGQPPIQLLNPHGVCAEGDRLIVVDMGHDRILSMPLADDR